MRRKLIRATLGLTVAGGLTALLAWQLLPRVSLYPADLTWSRVVLDRNGAVAHLTLSSDSKYRWFQPLPAISPDVVAATLLHEDRYFARHPGINPLSMLRAAGGWFTGKRRGGGSTITMQYARLRWRLETRSLPGKAWQMVRALQLERHYAKDEILEAYLNLAPYGGNVEGIGAASLLWCGKRAKELTLREAVTLSVLPQSPARRRPRADTGNSALAAAQLPLIRKIQVARGLRADPLEDTFTLPPPLAPPRGVPHLARRLLAQAPRAAAIGSTIDPHNQEVLEQSMADYLARKGELGINNASALLVHAPTCEVLGYAGSARFLDDRIHGQVDGVTARRSPGSALKPFIYALALDQGLIHPRTLVNDARLGFGSYNPENFDRAFAGPIPAAEALFRSRNIPAVALAQKLAAPGLYGFLKQAGVALPQPAHHYGLALPLGGAEVSLEELASLYVMLANDGLIRRLRFAQDQIMDEGRALLSPAACHLVRGMLRQTDAEQGADDPAVSWKTGTSHGFRDAWAAGIRGDFVLVVWIGNFNGKGNPAFVARECAAPLLFEAFRRLRLPSGNRAAPEGVAAVELCAVSGQLPTPLCRHRLHGGFMPGVSPIAPCAIHQEVFVDGQSGLRVRTDDGRADLKREVYECWPPDLLALFQQAGLPRKEPPPFEPAALMAGADTGQMPKIASPRDTLVYHVRAGFAAQRGIPLLAETAPGVRKVYWFAGSQFIGSSPPAEPMLWQADAGKWTLHVLDDHGRSSSCQLRVEMVQ